jgi:hypothetical protein
VLLLPVAQGREIKKPGVPAGFRLKNPEKTEISPTEKCVFSGRELWLKARRD